ncbi:hypothetical protein WJX72_006431 [[Myrmecia] bisecta]|uniref:N-acetylglucosaminylphosphatidylinositol deacetylase n=1 Tax=[Myrmecia] bisecta TaxID=41462 RepID=A0AAW1Q7Y8_9CHLO
MAWLISFNTPITSKPGPSPWSLAGAMSPHHAEYQLRTQQVNTAMPVPMGFQAYDLRWQGFTEEGEQGPVFGAWLLAAQPFSTPPVVFSVARQPGVAESNGDADHAQQQDAAANCIPRRVLLLTAHPDDELIFFSPTLFGLEDGRTETFLLVVSNGNARGLGSLRARELKQAGAVLQLDSSHIEVLNHPQLQDGHNTTWNETLIAELLHKQVVEQNIDTVITFDNKGVSGHGNHVALNAGARKYLETCRMTSQGCASLWVLVTTPHWRKYTMMLDVLPSTVEGGSMDRACYVNRHLGRGYKAMREYHSQRRWWVHVLFTRYTYVNTLQRISDSDRLNRGFIGYSLRSHSPKNQEEPLLATA